MLQLGYHVSLTDISERYLKSIALMSYLQWQQLHQITSILFTACCLWHLWRHKKYYRKFFKAVLWRRCMQLNLFSVFFLIATTTGFVAWILRVMKYNTQLAHIWVETHDKLAIVMLCFALLHIIKRFNRMF